MTIYFSTNIPEMRSIFQLNRSSNKIADISHRLETGQRINSGKDDPEGLIIRDRLRADIKGLYTAKDNASRADNMLSIADSGLASLQKYVLGEKDDGTSGLKALIGSQLSNAAESDELKSKISQILDQMNGVTRSTTYNGKQVINGDLAYKTNLLTDGAKLSNLNISKANGGNQEISVNVTGQATNANYETADTTAYTAAVNDAIKVTVNGKEITHTFTATMAASANAVFDALNADTAFTKALTDAGVTMTNAAGVLTFEADELGSRPTIAVSGTGAAISGISSGSTFTAGKDIEGTVTVGTNTAESFTGTGTSVRYTGNGVSFSAEAGNVTGASKFTVSGGATFQIGKNVVADQQLKFGLASANTSNLGGASGNLNDLLGLDYTNAADVKKASAIVDEAIDGINKQRGQIGFMQGSVLKPTAEYLEDNLTAVTAAEGNISNVDVAFESSRLAREELLANNAMNAALFNRSYAQFLVSSLW